MPIDRTSKTSLDSNLSNGITSDAPKVKANNDTLYNFVDTLESADYTHANNTTLAHPDQSVTTAKIKNGAVTNQKLAESSVTQGKIAENSVGNSQIIAGAITEDKIAHGTMDIRYYTKSQTEDRIANAYANDRFIDGGSFADTYNGNLTGIDGGVW